MYVRLTAKTSSFANSHSQDEENLTLGVSSDQVSEEFTWTEEEETIVRRKLDKIIIPVTTFLYLLCFLDR